MADELEELLLLDVTPALAEVDRLGDRLADVAAASTATIAQAIVDGVTQGLAQIPEAQTIDIPVRTDLAEVDGLEVRLADIDGTTAAVTADVDSSQVDETAAAVDAIDGTQATVEVAADGTAVEEVQATVDGIDDRDVTVTVEADATAVGEVQAELDGLSDAQVDVEVTADASAVEEVQAELDGLADTTVEVTVDADASAAVEATGQVAELDETAKQASQTVVIDVDASGVDEATAAVDGLGEATASAAGGIESGGAASSSAAGGFTEGAVAASAFSGEAGLLGGALSKTGLGAAAFAATLGTAFNSALEATESITVAKNVLGEYANEIERVEGVAGAADLSQLAIRLGSDDDAIRIAASRFAQLGVAQGESQQQSAAFARDYIKVGAALRANDPSLGSVEAIMQRLPSVFLRGGRAASAMGVNLTTAEVNARALADTGKTATEDLTLFDKQAAGLALTLEQLGGKAGIGDKIAEGFKNPSIAFDAFKTAIEEVVEAAGSGLIEPVISALAAAEPIITATVTAFGDGLGGAFALVGEVAEALRVPLEKIAWVVERIGPPAITAAVAYIGLTKGLGGVAAAAGRAASGLGRIASAVGAEKAAAGLDKFGVSAGSAQRNLVRLESAQAAAQKASTALAAGVAGVSTATAAGAAVQETYARVVTATAAAQRAATAAAEADMAVRSAREAVLAGEVGATARLDAALATQAVAQQAVTTTGAEAASAEEAFATATSRASVANVEGAVAARGLAVANTQAAKAANDAALAQVNTARSARIVGIAFHPVTLAIAAGAIVWKSFREEQEKQEVANTEAAASLDRYVDSLNLSNKALAELDPARATEAFRTSTERVNEFKESLAGKGIQTDIFDDAKVSSEELAAALAGSEEAVDAVQKKLERNAGNRVADPRILVPFITTNREKAHDAAEDLRRLAKAQRDKEAADVQSVETSIRKGKIDDLDAARRVVATDAVQKLTAEQRRAIAVLLAETDAKEAAQVKTDELAGSVATLTGAQRDLFEAGQAGDIGAARALAASAGYDTMDESVRELNDGLIANADAALESAQANGELVSSTGEVAGSMAGLADQLDTAISKYLELSGAQSGVNASARDVRGLLDDIAPTVEKLGATVDDTSASFTAGQVTVDNYKAILDTLPDAVRVRIEAIGADTATAETSKVASAADRLQARVDAVKAAYAQAQTQDLDTLPDIDVAIINTENVDRYLARLDEASQQTVEIRIKEIIDAEVRPTRAGPKLSTDEIDKQKAAAVSAAIAAGEATDDTGRAARDNARELAGFFDQVGGGIRQNAADMLSAGEDADTVIATLQANARAFSAEMQEAFVATGLSAKDAENRAFEVLAAQRLLDPQVKIDFELSGIDKVVQQLDRMNLILLSLTGLIDEGELADLLAIDGDAVTQAAELEAILTRIGNKKDGAATEIALRAILDAPTMEDAERARDEAQLRIGQAAANDPVTLAIEAGVEPVAAQKAKDDIDALAKERGVPIVADPDMIEALAALDAVTQERIANINTDDAEVRARRINTILNDAARARDAIITVKTVAGEGTVLKPGGAPDPGNVDRFLSYGGGQAPAPTAQSFSPDRAKAITDARAVRNFSLADQFARMTEEEYRNWLNLFGPGRRAEGGPVGIDDDEMRKLLGTDRRADIGLNAAGSYGTLPDGTVTSEDGTGGEWVISRDRAHRPANLAYAQAAVADLGGPRVVQPIARPVVTPAASAGLAATSLRLDSVEAGLGAVVAAVQGVERAVGNAPRPSGGVNIERLVAPDPLTAARSLTDVVNSARHLGADL